MWFPAHLQPSTMFFIDIKLCKGILNFGHSTGKTTARKQATSKKGKCLKSRLVQLRFSHRLCTTDMQRPAMTVAQSISAGALPLQPTWKNITVMQHASAYITMTHTLYSARSKKRTIYSYYSCTNSCAVDCVATPQQYYKCNINFGRS